MNTNQDFAIRWDTLLSAPVASPKGERPYCGGFHGETPLGMLWLDGRCGALIACVTVGPCDEGIMMLRLTPLGLAAGAMVVAMVSLAAPSAWAFSLETIGGDASGSSRYNMDSSSNSQGARPFGSGGPTLQFGTQQGMQPPFSHGPASGFGSSASQPPPQPYNLNNPNRE